MSKYYNWNKNGNKMIINSGFVTFDKQTNYISSGNVISNTQYSGYIRKYNDIINPVGQKVEKGHLFNFDLQYFNISNAMRDYIENLNEYICLYEFSIKNKRRKNIIGWLIQRENKDIEIFVNNEFGINYSKRYLALVLAKNIIVENLERR